MAFFSKEKEKKPSLDELYEILESLGDEDKEKIKERFFDAERDEVKAYANEEIAKDDAEEGRTEEAKKEDEKADEEKSESESEEGKVEDEVDESVADSESVAGGEVTDSGDAEQKVDEAEESSDALEKILETLTTLEARIAQLEHANEEKDGDAFGVDSDFSDELLPEMPQAYRDKAKSMRY